MFRTRLFSVMLSVGMLLLAGLATAQAQTEKPSRRWSRIVEQPDFEIRKAEAWWYRLQTEAARAEQAADAGKEQVQNDPPIARGAGGLPRTVDRGREANMKALAGTWLIDIPQPATGLPPFRALQTFHADGTFTETSDLLATLTEGPAHGVWDYDGVKYNLTFQLFVFDENRNPAGIVRVRCAIKLVNPDELVADSAVDFIDPDGNVIADIDSSPFTGKRIKIVPR